MKKIIFISIAIFLNGCANMTPQQRMTAAAMMQELGNHGYRMQEAAQPKPSYRYEYTVTPVYGFNGEVIGYRGKGRICDSSNFLCCPYYH